MVIKFPVSQTRPHAFPASYQPFLLFITWLLHVRSTLRESTRKPACETKYRLLQD